MIDVNAWIGAHRWRDVPGTDAAALVGRMDRLGIDEAWVSHLPTLYSDDPAAGNAALLDAVRHVPRLRPVPSVRPDRAGWEHILHAAREARLPAVRADPGAAGLDPAGDAMHALAREAGEVGVPLLLTVRLEDGRQRQPEDRAPELPAAAVRALVRAHPAVRLVVTSAERGFIEEVHFGSTPDEAARLWWDITWIWGPPEDHLALLLETIGPARFLFGSGQPLRLAETPIARLDLTPMSAEARRAIEHGNAMQVGVP